MSAQPSNAEIGRGLSRRLVDDIYTRGDLDALDEILAPDWFAYDAVQGEIRRDEFHDYMVHYHRVLTEMRAEIHYLVAEGDWVATYLTVTARHTGGEFLGLAPTGREFTLHGCDFSRVGPDGRFVESRGFFDALGVLKQLGAAEERLGEAEWRS
jgi:predicted ester cyclase